jgi:hypothetical protein
VVSHGTAVVSHGTAVVSRGTAVVSRGTAVVSHGTAVVRLGPGAIGLEAAVLTVGPAVVSPGTAVTSPELVDPSLAPRHPNERRSPRHAAPSSPSHARAGSRCFSGNPSEVHALLKQAPMLRSLSLALLASASVLLSSAAARADSIGVNGYPDRVVDGVDLGVATRPFFLHPLGVNQDDCARDMTLRYTLELSGFEGHKVQLWASTGADCTAPEERGIGATAASCWLVAESRELVQESAAPFTFDARVQDLVGSQTAPPVPPRLTHMDGRACSAQPSFVPVTLKLFFFSVDDDARLTGGAYETDLETDLVGPPAPAGVDAAGLPTLTWRPNQDVDTIGYDVFDEAHHLLGADAQTGVTVPDKGSAQFTVASLPAGATTLGVAAVDAMGNVGSPVYVEGTVPAPMDPPPPQPDCTVGRGPAPAAPIAAGFLVLLAAAWRRRIVSHARAAAGRPAARRLRG